MNMFKVGVIMGGKGVEREVSFNSGRTVCDHLDTNRYEIIPLYQTEDNQLYILPWNFLYRGKTTDFEHRLAHQAQRITWDDLKNLIDFAYIAMHGRFAEDGTLQGVLETLSIPYLGSGVFSSAIGMHKTMQKVFLRDAGIAVAHDIVIKKYEIITTSLEAIVDRLHETQIQFPVVVKPVHEGSSFGISVVHDSHDLMNAVYKAAHVTEGIVQDVVIEQKIEGMEFSCIVLFDYTTNSLRALPPTEIVYEIGSDFFDYEQKYMPGRALKFTPARCDESIIHAIQTIACTVMQTLGFRTIGRIDGIVQADGAVVIIDPNSLCGMAPSSFFFKQAAEVGMNHADVINYLIESELHQRGMLEKIQSLTRKQHGDTMENKKRIAVLFGGNSHEKEISLESGRNVIYKLSPDVYSVIPVFVDSDLQLYHITNKLLVCNSTHEITIGLNDSMKLTWDQLSKTVDFVFIALHGGHGENGSIQAMLEMLSVPYNGSGVLTTSLCLDKYKTNQFLHAQGFNVPQGALLSPSNIHHNLSYPCIVKPHDDGCSVGVKKVFNDTQLQSALAELFESRDYALMEELVAGMELTVGVLGNDEITVLPPTQTVVQKDILSIEEKFLPGQGENQTPALLPESALLFVKDVIGKVYKTLECSGYARIDCFYQSAQQSPTGEQRVVILEINSLPGLTPATCIFHQAAEIGLKPMEFIDRIIQLGFEKHQPAIRNDFEKISRLNK